MTRSAVQHTLMAAVVTIALAGSSFAVGSDDDHELPPSPSPLPPAETPPPTSPPMPPDQPGSPQV